MNNNDTNDLFLRASRQKLIISTASSGGQLDTTDLWDLSLERLDGIARDLNMQMQEYTTQSFIPEEAKASSKSAARKKTELAFEIVKLVIVIKAAELKAAKARKEMLAQRAVLKEALNAAEHKKLLEMSPEDIRKQLDQLSQEDTEAEA